MANINRLEMALLDPTGIQLDLYLEDEKTLTIMADIEAIRIKAATSTEAGKLREKLLQILNEF